jgi:hypothetical protein
MFSVFNLKSFSFSKKDPGSLEDSKNYLISFNRYFCLNIEDSATWEVEMGGSWLEISPGKS